MGVRFVLATDHKPLLSVFGPKKGILEYSANRLRRWALVLSHYDYIIQFVKSEANYADSLSRIPLSTTHDNSQELHETHMGVVKSKSLARSYFWWPKLDKQIEELCKNYMNYNRYKNNPPKSELNPWPFPSQPWKRILIDYLGPLLGKYILEIVDAYTKWVEVFVVNTITNHSTINPLRPTFARFGLPKLLISDNAPQFSHCNGAAENSVKLIKNAIKNALGSSNHVDFNLVLSNFLFDYRNSPHCSTGKTPAMLMFKHCLRTRFNLLKPHSDMSNPIKVVQSQQRQCYKGKRTVDFVEGEAVMVRDYRTLNKPKWIAGDISKRIGKVTYLVQIPELDRKWKRHVNQIRKLIK
ncbi:hypothetical protein Trydic_g1166 [Trypoxylus dichotomus]